MPFATIPEAIQDFQAGKMVIIVDDEDRKTRAISPSPPTVQPEIINSWPSTGAVSSAFPCPGNASKTSESP